MSRRWPVELVEGRVGLRPLKRSDASAWREVRARNDKWLRRWEATAPGGVTEAAPTFAGMVGRLRREAKDGRVLPFVITYRGRLAGQLTVGGIYYGSQRSAQVGYWVDEKVAGRGVVPTALAMAVDHCFDVLGLHRIEVNIRPENVASLRVVEKLGFRDEGIRERYLHIDGAWRDHRTFALTVEDLDGDGLLRRWQRVRPAQP